MLEVFYGNASKQQDSYERRVAANISADLLTMEQEYKITGYTLVGKLRHPPEIARMIEHYPSLDELVKINLREDYKWGPQELKYFGVDTPSVGGEWSAVGRDQPHISRRDYEIYEKGRRAYVLF